MGEVRVTSSVEVAVSPRVAWSVIADFSRNPQWQGGMRACTWLTPPPVEVGSRYRQEARFLGRRITTTFEVVALAPPDRDGYGSVTIRSVASTFPLEVTRTVAPVPAGCRVGATVSGRPDGWMGAVAPVLAALVRRSVDGDYRRLRAMLEGGAARSGPPGRPA